MANHAGSTRDPTLVYFFNYFILCFELLLIVVDGIHFIDIKQLLCNDDDDVRNQNS